MSSIPGKKRTRGDGMESILSELPESKLSFRSTTSIIETFKPISPGTRVINLVPKYVPKERKCPKYLVRKPKEPKFIPYEPYKGAVDPIIPHKNIVKPKSSKNNVEIQELVEQMSQMRTVELEETKEEKFISEKEWGKQKESYKTDIKNLRETNAHLENQLKFQAQVNGELKTLLVAAVGEDLESRVQHLTEDKLQLARALLNSANHLTSHQEQTEWLSGQCEVWRSKFLASSLMVEELARWKSALSTRVNDLQQTLKALMEDRYKIHKKLTKTYCYLQNGQNNLTQCHILDLSHSIYKLSQGISELLNYSKDNCDKTYGEILKLPQYTPAEKNALKLLQNPVNISNKQDAICNALRGTAMSLTTEQMYLQHPTGHATCCAHCTGQVENI